MPLQFAQHCQAAADDRPGDVVLLVKSSLASPDLQQPVVTLCQAGASWKLGRAPSAWLGREVFGEAYVKNLRKLGDEVLTHFPRKTKVIAYLNAWLRASRVPAVPPDVPAMFDLPEEGALGMCTPQIASRAAQAVSGVVGTGRIVGVKRFRRAECAGWRREAALVSDLPLELYVAYRLSVGGTREEATADWHAAHQARSVLG